MEQHGRGGRIGYRRKCGLAAHWGPSKGNNNFLNKKNIQFPLGETSKYGLNGNLLGFD
jgi:hypothetical protein